MVCQELGSFYQYAIDVKTCSCVLTWWWTKKTKVSNNGYIYKTNFGNPS